MELPNPQIHNEKIPLTSPSVAPSPSPTGGGPPAAPVSAPSRPAPPVLILEQRVARPRVLAASQDPKGNPDEEPSHVPPPLPPPGPSQAHLDEVHASDDDTSEHGPHHTYLSQPAPPEEEEVYLSEEDFEENSSCTKGQFRVIKHKNTTRKLKNWQLIITEPVLIIGDSNLSQIGTHNLPGVQIDSFPGATFRNAAQIMKTAIIRTDVNKIILSFGLNSRECDPKATGERQLLQALRETKKRFPQAQVFVPLINFSPDLPPQQQENLFQLNYCIQDHCFPIPLIYTEDFQTTQDNIHWTQDTAHFILEHWARTLNL